MDNSSVTLEAGFVWAYNTKYNLKAGLPWFHSGQFHKNSVACGKVKKDMVSDCKLFFYLVGIICM